MACSARLELNREARVQRRVGEQDPHGLEHLPKPLLGPVGQAEVAEMHPMIRPPSAVGSLEHAGVEHGDGGRERLQGSPPVS